MALLSGDDSSIGNGIYYAERIYLFLTVAEVNAWHYWWLNAYSTSNEGLMDTNANPTKRMFALGNYSRFVRPGFYRIGVSNNASTFVSAYKDPASANFAIVAVNPVSATVTQIFNLSGFSAGAVTPWITSVDQSLSSQADVPVSGSSFSYSIPAASVVTFVGQANLPNSAPTLQQLPDQTLNAGVTLMLTNTATDPDVPSQTLSFTLLDAPSGATLTKLDATDALLVWRPSVSQANTTNLVTVEVADNGQPILSATNRFNIIVNPLTRPRLSSVKASGGKVSLVVNGPSGPDYTLLTSTNLLGWQSVLTAASPAMPTSLVDTNHPSDSKRFYRVQIGP